jgi:hypothetical protein
MSAAIGVAESPEGALAYAIPFPPEATPPVRPEALLDAWGAARAAATAGCFGPARRFLFLREDEEPLSLDLADRDARCWAEAVDRASPIDRAPGLALCLRLLALIDLLSHAGWTRQLFALDRDGPEFHPALLAAAATAPLDSSARFDAARLRAGLPVSLTAPSGRIA